MTVVAGIDSEPLPSVSRVGALTGALAVATAGLTIALWPAASRVVPPCPFHAFTGLDCPGCGGTRAVEALARGDVPAAVGHNAVAVLVVLPLVLWLWTTWVRERPSPSLFRSPRFMPIAAVVMAVFTVVRNVGVDPFQALAA